MLAQAATVSTTCVMAPPHPWQMQRHIWCRPCGVQAAGRKWKAVAVAQICVECFFHLIRQTHADGELRSLVDGGQQPVPPIVFFFFLLSLSRAPLQGLLVCALARRGGSCVSSSFLLFDFFLLFFLHLAEHAQCVFGSGRLKRIEMFAPSVCTIVYRSSWVGSVAMRETRTTSAGRLSWPV